MNIWRLQTNTASDEEKKIADYCLENKIIAIGWSLKNLPNDQENDRANIVTFDDYIKFIEDYNVYGGKLNSNVKRFYYDIKTDDLIWMRSSGIYYLGRVTEDSNWTFNTSDEARKFDAANQITNIQWYRIGDESSVPGAIATSLIRGMTLQKIWKEGVFEYSQLIFNEMSNTKHYKVAGFEKNADTFYSLLSTDDCEDLLCLWLYAKYGYITIPSTNKKSTECYECILKDPKSGKNIYPQVKAGTVTLYESHYEHLNGEVWLFTTKGSVVKNTSGNRKNIFIADPEELFDFVGTRVAKNILPESIINWYDKLFK